MWLERKFVSNCLKMHKYKIPIIIFIASFAVFLSSSYSISLQAKIYYWMRDYKKANDYAQKAYKKDKYNNQALFVLNQSKTALSYEEYISRGERYIKEILRINSQKPISKNQKAKIKLMCEIMLEEFEELKKSSFVDKKLKNRSKNTYKSFKEINLSFFRGNLK